MSKETVESVQKFWEENPLFKGETTSEPGTPKFYEEIRALFVNDLFAGVVDPRVYPGPDNSDYVLDLGCGPGNWSIELAQNGSKRVVAADLTRAAVDLTKKRAEIQGVDLEVSQQNAEAMTFPDETFSHVNCNGVIHHTPDTEGCVREIARVLRPGGTAMISVYYKNVVLNLWPIAKYLGKIARLFGAKIKGRGRDGIYAMDDVNEIVRIYDGDENPIGKAYNDREYRAMLEPYFEVEHMFLHFFPARSLPFPIPRFLHRFLDRTAGFMIFAVGRKKSTENSEKPTADLRVA
jgi:SAM-dependent methyltransferase